MADHKVLDRFRVPTGKTRIDLEDWDTDETGPFAGPEGKERAQAEIDGDVERIDSLQERLYAARSSGLLVVLQAMDTGGKDGTVRKVFGPLNAQGVTVTSFKKPTPEELAHDYLWRIHQAAPGRGDIAVFNRSHYEDVLVVRVHEWVSKETIERRYGEINAFEALLHHSGIKVLKIFLHISKKEQKQRLEERLADPDKHWKFNPDDLSERKLWKEYRQAYEIALARCSTPHAPWFVVPADRKWFRNWLVAKLVRRALEDLKPEFPPSPKGFAKIRIPD